LLKPPSRKAIQSRILARSPRELATARDGADAARQQYTPVAPGLRPGAPLAIVQIDHTPVDIQIVDDRSRAVLGRPWLTLRRCCMDLGCGRSCPSPAVVQAMRTEIGRPSSSIRLSAWTATSTSVARRRSVHERNPSPITCLSLPMAASTRDRFV